MIGKLLIVLGIMVLLVGCVSAYYCIQEEDNNSVKQFKTNVDFLAIQHDLANGVSPEAIDLKIKYFGPCK